MNRLPSPIPSLDPAGFVHGRLHQHQDGVRLIDGGEGLVDHELVELAPRLVDAGGIKQRHLKPGPGDDAHDPVSRGLGLGADDCQPLPTAWLSSVDLPTLGRPMMAASPAR